MTFSLTDISCIALSAGVLVYMGLNTRFSFQKHTLNIYSYIMIVLIAYGLIVRAFFFLTTIGAVKVATNERMASLIWTWPLFCQQMAAYVLS
jgi:hypothetical protein